MIDRDIVVLLSLGAYFPSDFMLLLYYRAFHLVGGLVLLLAEIHIYGLYVYKGNVTMEATCQHRFVFCLVPLI